jgi:glycerol-3-phosphate cytidylyltransferase
MKREGIVGFTSSAFDLFHAGHVAMLAEAKQHCDFLVVGLLIDPTKDRPDSKNRPVQTAFERWLMIQANQYIDEIIPFETEKDLEDMIKIIKPHLRFVGEEYKDVEHTGKHIEGVKIIYNERRHTFSSSELRERVLATK